MFIWQDKGKSLAVLGRLVYVCEVDADGSCKTRCY